MHNDMLAVTMVCATCLSVALHILLLSAPGYGLALLHSNYGVPGW
jgi:hypothetical protein